jgi:hypothetical protein
LEVADFIVHAIGGQARANLLAQAPLRRDFRSVFDIHDQRLASSMSIDSVTVDRGASSANLTEDLGKGWLKFCWSLSHKNSQS